MPVWINFKELRQQLRFADVLRHYGVQAKIKGDRATALCPLPGHTQRTDGTPRTASLSVNLTRNIFQCFGCHQSGNALEFACRMEGFDPSNTDQFRQAALKIAEVFKINARGLGGESKPEQVPAKPQPVAASTPIVNAPLNFELQALDPKHPYLASRGFIPDTVAYFGLGFCNRGLMKGRIAIPIHDTDSRLVGYAGRITKDEMISDECPKYRFPGSRVAKGVQHEFRKSLLLYNYHRVGRNLRHLVVVEGFPSTWWIHQCGYPYVVALMGSSCSEEQGELIAEITAPDGVVSIMPDGNEAGIHCAHSVFEHVASQRLIRWGRLLAKQQPTDCSPKILKSILSN